MSYGNDNDMKLAGLTASHLSEIEKLKNNHRTELKEIRKASYDKGYRTGHKAQPSDTSEAQAQAATVRKEKDQARHRALNITEEAIQESKRLFFNGSSQSTKATVHTLDSAKLQLDQLAVCRTSILNCDYQFE